MVVALYIYTEQSSSEIVSLTSDSSLLTADASTITADATETTSLETVMVSRRIELFNDEKISITSSIQNVNDISKIFTDYSQSFTIPASKVNNDIFKHWYENAIDNGFDQRVRYDGYIEIDDAVFRTGRWQIEGASVKDNRIENYKLTFYGVLKSLKDKFGEDKLISLNTINALAFDYSFSNVYDRVKTGSDSGVMFPLISSNRLWQYGGAGANDITNGSTGIHPNELFPAVKLSSILYAIGEKYGVTFTGNFLNQTRFSQAYLWLKNKETFVQRSNILDITGSVELFDIGGSDTSREFYANVNVGAGVFYILNVFKDGLPYGQFSGTGPGVVTILTQFYQSLNDQYTGTYTFNIQTDVADTFNIVFTELINSEDMGYITTVDNNFDTGSITTTSLLDLAAYMPDMKIADFFSGVLKMFNLTAFSLNETIYTLEQIETWYQSGTIKDFTEYTFTDLEFERIKAYKKIDFKYQKCESLINRNFYDAFSREYGDLTYSFSNDGADYNIELPFENLQFANLDGANLNVGYALQTAPDYKPYISKPIIIYKYGNVNAAFDMYDGSSYVTIPNYNAFGQDVIYNGALNSLNWGAEYSLYSSNYTNNSLFKIIIIK
jgi:hypothetical protein